MASQKTKKQPGNEFPRYLQFKSHRLSKKAREYQHEIGHLTSDLLTIDQKLQRSLALCQLVIKTIGKPSVRYRISLDKDLENFQDILYHMENFIFRSFAYRDKLALFLNFALDAPFEEGEMNLIKRFLTFKEAKKSRISTEVARLYRNPVKDILERRKIMSHRAYYKPGIYSPLFFPEIDTKELGPRKTSIAWRKKVVAEVEKIDDCLSEIFTVNANITKKLKKYLDNHAI
jgi:hypothetical protein